MATSKALSNWKKHSAAFKAIWSEAERRATEAQIDFMPYSQLLDGFISGMTEKSEYGWLTVKEAGQLRQINRKRIRFALEAR